MSMKGVGSERVEGRQAGSQPAREAGRHVRDDLVLEKSGSLLSE